MKENKIRGLRLILAGTALFFIVIVVLRIFFEESKSISPMLISNTTLLIALWIIIIIFSLIFVFIFVRNIIKHVYEKKKDTGQGRFQNRLVFFFVTFSMVPTLLLFFFATDFINRGIDKWFRTDFDLISNQISALNKSYYEKAKEDLIHFAKIIADDIKEKKKYTEENRIFLYNSLKQKMKEYNLDVVNVYSNHVEILSLFNPVIPLQEYKDLPLEIVYSGLGGSKFIRIDPLKDGELIRSGTAFNTKEGDKILVIIGKYFPEDYIINLKKLNAMVNRYNQLKEIKDPVKTTYLLLFIFITILIIFSASWLGIYLARGITVPIDKLVSAASRVSKGDLNVNIEYTTNNEFNTLISEFNRMVKELKENRDKLNRRSNELRQRRNITESILKNITSGVIALDSEGKLLDINPEAEKMLFIDSKNLDEKHYSEILSKNIHKDIKELIDTAYKTKFKLIEKEIEFKVKGKITNLSIKITHIRNPLNNKFYGILVVVSDLTDLLKAQQMMVWKEVAKRIAHEIKNPLTPIQISAERIIKSFELSDEKFRKTVEEALKVMLEELESIKKLADEFSNFARLPEIKFTKADINQLLEKLITVYESIYQNVKFNVKLDENVPILIKLDPEQIKRIFVNIFDNAIEAMDKKGEIEVKTFYNRDTQFVRIEIADNGPGISDDEKKKLFIPYFSTKTTGTGLGLAISHHIIQEHNGKITVVDNEPKGAKFIIELPA